MWTMDYKFFHETIDFMIDFKIKIFFNGFDKIEINGKFIGQFSEKLVFN